MSSSDFTKPEWQSEAGDDSEDAITRRLNRSYLAGATEAAEIALRDTAMVAGQHSNAAASAIGDMTVEQIVKLTNRGYTILNATLQSATERMACGHLKADTLEAKHGFSQEEMAEMGSTVSCLICAENHAHYLKGYEAGAISVDVKAATATAMAQQREVDAKLANLRIVVPRRGEGCEIAARQRDYIAREIRNAPLASAPARGWLEQHDTEARNEMRRWVTSSIIEYPNGGGDIGVMKALEQQLAAARAGAYERVYTKLFDHINPTVYQMLRQWKQEAEDDASL